MFKKNKEKLAINDKGKISNCGGNIELTVTQPLDKKKFPMCKHLSQNPRFFFYLQSRSYVKYLTTKGRTKAVFLPQVFQLISLVFRVHVFQSAKRVFFAKSFYTKVA